jgi:hypothetical protein
MLCFSQTSAADEVAKGYELVRLHCQRCHIVDESNRFSGISSTPSFQTMITALSDWPARFDTFYARNPHQSIIHIDGMTPRGSDVYPNEPVNLTQSDLAAIMAYVKRYAKEVESTKQ